MSAAPTVLELSLFMLASLSVFLFMVILMRLITINFFDGDEDKLNDFFK